MELGIKMKGVRVVRGPDWKWEDQDEGEGHVGTIAEVRSFLKVVGVVWDSGEQNIYRVGCQGGYDLAMLENATIGVSHPGMECKFCRESPILGLRFRCSRCEDYDLCCRCYMCDTHILGHQFVRFETPTTAGVLLPPRDGSKKVYSVGTFKGAKVVRGPDWKWGDEDCATHHRVSCCGCGLLPIRGIRWTCMSCPGVDLCTACYVQFLHPCHDFWRILSPQHEPVPANKRMVGTDLLAEDKESYRIEGEVKEVYQTWKQGANNGVLVAWPGGHIAGYRLGHQGCVDVINTEPSLAGSYYPDHLPTLGRYSDQLTRRPFEVGDFVIYNFRYEIIEKLQYLHGGWNASMAKCSRQYGQVTEVVSEEEIKVRIDGREWLFNAEIFLRIIPNMEDLEDTAEKVETSREDEEPIYVCKMNDDEELNIGDLARVEVDPEPLRTLQQDRGGWVEDLTEYIGKVGRVDMINDLVVHLAYGDGEDRKYYAFHSDAVKKVCLVSVGDQVRISSDVQLVRSLQEDRCGWTPVIEAMVGCLGDVTDIDCDGDIEVRVKNTTLWFDSRVCFLTRHKPQPKLLTRPQKIPGQRPAASHTDSPIRGRPGSLYSKLQKRTSSRGHVDTTRAGVTEPTRVTGGVTPRPGDSVRQLKVDKKEEEEEEDEEVYGVFPQRVRASFHGSEGVASRSRVARSHSVPDDSNRILKPSAEHRPLPPLPQMPLPDVLPPAPPPPLPPHRRKSQVDDPAEVEGERMRELERQMSDLKASMSCTICLKRPKTLAFDCGHSACLQCGQLLTECHICRRIIKKKIPLFD